MIHAVVIEMRQRQSLHVASVFGTLLQATILRRFGFAPDGDSAEDSGFDCTF